MRAFAIGQLPRIEFGSGRRAQLAPLIAAYGSPVLLVTGAHSLMASPFWQELMAALEAREIRHEHVRIDGEPGPEAVDEAVRRFAVSEVKVVVGIGGGSVLDAAKAVAGLLRIGDSVMDYLEGMPMPPKPYQGPRTPFIAVPTTAGTGSEATKNAVITQAGTQGFKRSFRDDALVADVALIDPDFLATCPAALIAANGMDALTQLLEAYVSRGANTFTDALAIDGLERVIRSLKALYIGAGDLTLHRQHMAYGALLSGVCLAQAGLGSVHGLAQPFGSLFGIPHGVVCGTLLPAATEINVEVLECREPASEVLLKYARVGRLFDPEAKVDGVARRALLEGLKELKVVMAIPGLTALGIRATDVPEVIAHCRNSGMKNNPVALEDAEIQQLIERSL